MRHDVLMAFSDTTAVAVGDLTFDVRHAGPDDGTAVVLLHGFPATSLSWSSVVPALADAGLRCGQGRVRRLRDQ